MKKIFVYFELPGVTGQQYENVWNDIKATGFDEPKGLLHHTGVQKGTSLVVVDVWESPETFQKFGEVLMPLLAKNNFPDVQPLILPVLYDLVPQGQKSAVA